MNEIDWRTVPVAELVPHRPPMLLLTGVTTADDQQLTAQVQLDHQSPFVDANAGAVPGWVGIEYLAQAIAAWSGARARRAGGAVQLGFLLGTRRYQLHVPQFALGQTLRVQVQCLHLEDSGLGVFAGDIHGSDGLLAEAQVNVFEPPDPAAFLQEGQP